MLSITVAIAENNVIGIDGKMAWHFSDDLKHFKRTTLGGSATMIMGRKTFESLPYILPGRKHIILTQNRQYRVDHPAVEIIHSLEEIKPYIEAEEEYFLIGGGQLFHELLPYSDRLYITWVGKSFEGDTYFPEIPSDEFTLSEEWEEVDSETGIRLTYANYDRIGGEVENREWEAGLENSPD